MGCKPHAMSCLTTHAPELTLRQLQNGSDKSCHTSGSAVRCTEVAARERSRNLQFVLPPELYALGTTNERHCKELLDDVRIRVARPCHHCLLDGSFLRRGLLRRDLLHDLLRRCLFRGLLRHGLPSAPKHDNLGVRGSDDNTPGLWHRRQRECTGAREEDDDDEAAHGVG